MSCPALAAQKPRKHLRLNSADGLKYVWVPPGSFTMGCSPDDSASEDDEGPLHRVRLSHGFWLCQTEVTVEAFSRYAVQTGAKIPDDQGPARHPVTFVDWQEAAGYCKWIGGRLPTEAEWEYAARAGTSGYTYGGLERVAWFHDNSPGHPDVVATKQRNAFGLFDMLGNVWEWVADWYAAGYYGESPARDPGGPASGTHRVYRGGAFMKYPRFPRVSDRGHDSPSDRDLRKGFRCVWQP